MKRVHLISGLTITLFIGIHLFNHFWSIFGVEEHIELMDSLRVVYRNVVVETVLLSAVLVQMFSGIKLAARLRKKKKAFFEKLQVWTGLYLALFLVIHVGAVMAGRFVLHLDTNIYFGVAGLNTFPFSLFFLPYYALAIISFLGHIAAVHHKKMNRHIFGLSVARQSYLILASGIVLTTIILYGLTGGFASIEIPEAYNVLIGK